jgi:transglutaminase-like putative cysteine protease
MAMNESLHDRPLSRPILITAIALMIASVLPHFWHIEISVMLFFLVIAGIRLILQKPSQAALRKWLMLPLLVVGILLVYSEYNLPIGTQPGVAFLVTLFGLKILEVNKRRDIYVVTFIAFFTIATQFLFENGLLFTLYLMLVMILLILLLTALNRDEPESAILTNLRTLGGIILPAIPVTIMLFYLFPRLASPLWEITSHESIGVTGLSDSISLGTISQLSQSGATAFRVTFKGQVPEQQQLYWRGPVLWESDGKNWTTGPLQQQAPTGYELVSDFIEYDVVMEANDQPWLFALDLPATLPENTSLTRDFRLIAEKPITDTLQYSVTSGTDFINSEFRDDDAVRALQLPGRTTQRVRDFALELRQESAGDEDFINRILGHFNREPFIYTLRPPVLGNNPVDEFLFETRRGYCEHYATSFVTLARAAGIPARIVTGYQGGEFNPIGNYLRVRQSDAHAWAEVWFEQSGWVRIDPTAAVAPERVERTFDLADTANDGRLLFRADDKGLLARLGSQAKWLVDSVQLNWQRWVVNFDQKRQRNLLSMLGLDRLSRPVLMTISILAATIMVLLFTLLVMRLNRELPDPATRLYQRFSGKLSGIGLARHANEGPLDYLERIASQRPDLRERAGEVIGQYIRIRYREQDNKKQLQALARSVRQFSVR